MCANYSSFKRKRSTNKCTMMLKKTLSNYANNGGSVFCTLLEATKAFDLIMLNYLNY